MLQELEISNDPNSGGGSSAARVGVQTVGSPTTILTATAAWEGADVGKISTRPGSIPEVLSRQSAPVFHADVSPSAC